MSESKPEARPIDKRGPPFDRSMRALTLGVWFVALGLFANFALSLFPLVFPKAYMNRFSESIVEVSSEADSSSATTAFGIRAGSVPRAPEGRQFYELSPEEQIERASVIARLEYEPGPDGSMQAIFREFLKKDESVTLHYELGDEYPPSSYYPEAGTTYGDGQIAFFVGSPAQMRYAMSYFGDRISSLGDMPMELFRSKCGQADDA